MDIVAKSTSKASNPDTADRLRSCKTNGSIGIRAAIFLLQFVIMAIVFFLFSELNATTQQNSATLVRHEAKLSEHDSNFEAIYFGTFSREFATNVKRYIPNEQGR